MNIIEELFKMYWQGIGNPFVAVYIYIYILENNSRLL